MEESRFNLRQSTRPLTERSSAHLVLPRIIRAQRDARRRRVARARTTQG